MQLILGRFNAMHDAAELKLCEKKKKNRKLGCDLSGVCENGNY